MTNTEIFYDLWSKMISHGNQFRNFINDKCKHEEPFFLFLGTILTIYVLSFIYNYVLFPEESLRPRFKRKIFKFFRGLPYIKQRIQKEIEKTTEQIEDGFNNGQNGRIVYIQNLPQCGLSINEVEELCVEYRAMEGAQWNEGYVSGTVYNGDNELTQLMQKVYGDFAWSNPLHPDIFPDVRRMEAELVRMCCSLFHGDEKSCGTMTAGGTESILMACKSYRDWGYERGIKRPEILVPNTAHAAFDKAGHYFRMKVTHIPVDKVTCKVDVRAMRRAINRNVVMLVGSSPHFPHGIMDPIEEIAKLGASYKIPVHVDACLGGFLIPFMERAGFEIPPFDFNLPGVTSISCDTHKYGFAPKGSSVILYRSHDYRRYQFFVQPDWPGGVYACPSVAGSRPGALIAMTWATLMHFGVGGYVDATRKIVTTTREIARGLSEIPGLFIMGEPKINVVAMGSDKFNIFRLSDELRRLGWHLNPLQFPSSIHICVTLVHTKQGVARRFVGDCRAVVEEIMRDPNAKVGGMAAIYGMSQSIPDRSLVEEIAGSFIGALYTTKNIPDQQGDCPEENGEIPEM